MERIPTLFERVYENGRVLMTGRIVTRGCEWVLEGRGEATEMVDGSNCAIIKGEYYREYDARWGRPVPDGAIPMRSAPDPMTGRWPHLAKVDFTAHTDAIWVKAYENTPWCRSDGMYEAVGPHFANNPYGLDEDFLERHGRIKLRDCPRSYDGIIDYLNTHEMRGIVFWLDGKPGCKIERSDFGMKWPVKRRGGASDGG